MGRTSKSKAKRKTSKRQRIKDLSPKDSKQVKGGDKVAFQDLHFTASTNKATPNL